VESRTKRESAQQRRTEPESVDRQTSERDGPFVRADRKGRGSWADQTRSAEKKDVERWEGERGLYSRCLRRLAVVGLVLGSGGLRWLLSRPNSRAHARVDVERVRERAHRLGRLAEPHVDLAEQEVDVELVGRNDGEVLQLWQGDLGQGTEGRTRKSQAWKRQAAQSEI